MGGVGVAIAVGGVWFAVRGSATGVVTALSISDTKANQTIFQFVFSLFFRIGCEQK